MRLLQNLVQLVQVILVKVVNVFFLWFHRIRNMTQNELIIQDQQQMIFIMERLHKNEQTLMKKDFEATLRKQLESKNQTIQELEVKIADQLEETEQFLITIDDFKSTAMNFKLERENQVLPSSNCELGRLIIYLRNQVRKWPADGPERDAMIKESLPLVKRRLEVDRIKFELQLLKKNPNQETKDRIASLTEMTKILNHDEEVFGKKVLNDVPCSRRVYNDELYQLYHSYCSDNNIFAVNYSDFGILVRSTIYLGFMLGPPVHLHDPYRPRIKDDVRAYPGIMLKKDSAEN